MNKFIFNYIFQCMGSSRKNIEFYKSIIKKEPIIPT